jgi:tetratricopeptide (TPR) repeat protein
MLVSRYARIGAPASAALIQAEVASTLHRFDDARRHLARAALLGSHPADIERQLLAVDQACGVELEVVLRARRRLAAASGRLEDLVPLGAVLADLEHFAEADDVYQSAIHSYAGASPFPLAWVCFQLGALWGEFVHAPDARVAAIWYERAISYLPAYVKARVHLAEIRTTLGRFDDAEAALLPALSSSDPEVHWRLADVLVAQDRVDEAETHLNAARHGFDALLERYPLAFADHAAEFFAGSGNDARRALTLARANVVNRPTRRALEQMRSIAANAS